MSTDYDFIIRNGTIYDGSGRPPAAGDVAINGETIAAIGQLRDSRGRAELDARGLAVAPGFIETDMTSELPQEMKDGVIETAPAGRLGTPADISTAVLFLASREAEYITGQTLVVDGGLTL